MSSVTDSKGRLTQYSFDENGNQTRIDQANGTASISTFDALNRITTIDHLGTANQTLLRLDYSLDPTGRRTQISESTGRVSSYSYDPLYRLTAETIIDPDNGNHTASYIYDAVSNRVEETVNGLTRNFSYDANDSLLTAGADSYNYDENGSTISETVDGMTATYSYNSQNRLVGADKGGSVISMVYDPDGIRVHKSGNGETWDYLIDSNRDYAQVVYEQGPTSDLSYTFGLDLVGLSTATESYTYHTDALGSTRLISDSSGSVADDVRYDAWGGLLAGGTSVENQYLYTGEQFDSTLNQYYLRARLYRPESGTFTSMDTFEGIENDPRTLHKYLYTASDPVNLIDPSGNTFSLGSIGATLRVNGILSSSATASGRIFISRALTGAGKEAFGVIGEEVIGFAKEALLNILIQELAGPGFKNAGAKGTATHQQFEKLIENINDKYEKYGYTIHAEVFRDRDSKNPANRRAKGSFGIDVEVRDAKGKAVLAFDLKTGKGTSKKRNRKLQSVFGAEIIEIFVTKMN